MTAVALHDQPLAAFDGHILLVGAGQMGGALLTGWLRLGLDPSRVTVMDPSPPANIWAVISAAKVPLNPPEVRIADVLVLAVKPQLSEQVMPGLARFCGPESVVLSVMAGKTVAGMARHFGPKAAIIRTIPNTPAAVGRGMTGAFANAPVTASRRMLIDTLLSAVGRVAWVDDEALIDVVTAVSGSGPAYVFYLAEALAQAGIKAGLPHELAEAVARATVEGAGELLYRSPDVTPATLRQNVTSPNGTTHAALSVLMASDGLSPLLVQAVDAATRRSRELAG